MPVVPDGSQIVYYFWNDDFDAWCAVDAKNRAMCYIEKEWEWKNKWENDGTPDNS